LFNYLLAMSSRHNSRPQDCEKLAAGLSRAGFSFRAGFLACGFFQRHARRRRKGQPGVIQTTGSKTHPCVEAAVSRRDD
jgi:hypothetical protein